jgi:hypothetical protein
MRKTVLILAVLGLALLLTACEDEQPPTQIYVVLSPTPGPDATEAATEAATAEATAEATEAVAVQPTNTSAATQPPTRAATRPATTPTVQATPRPGGFPTDVVSQVQMAEQVFQHGRMFWLRHNRQIWVMVASEDDANSGDWFCYNDTFQEGEAETDPGLVPPQSDVELFQPRRGFGKIWRSHEDLKEALGWGLTPEFELTSDYRYIAGGFVDENGQYQRGPGEHRLTTLYNETVSFYERENRGDCQGGTWRIAPSQ